MRPGACLSRGVAVLLFLASLSAQAADTWTTPYAGVRRLHRKVAIKSIRPDLCRHHCRYSV